MDWPSQSPDSALLKQCGIITKRLLKEMTRPLSQRVQPVLKTKGGQTKYLIVQMLF